MRRHAQSLIAATFVLTSAGSALAQGAPPPPPSGPPGGYGPPPPPAYQPAPYRPPPPREGFMVGFSVGGGSQIPDCDNCESLSGFAFDFSIGGLLNPNLALMYDMSAVLHAENDYVFTNATNAFAAQFWAADKLWLKGGVGFGQYVVSNQDGRRDDSETAPAITGAVGYDLMQAGNFALSGALRFASVFYDSINISNASLLVGFHWY